MGETWRGGIFLFQTEGVGGGRNLSAKKEGFEWVQGQDNWQEIIFPKIILFEKLLLLSFMGKKVILNKFIILWSKKGLKLILFAKKRRADQHKFCLRSKTINLIYLLIKWILCGNHFITIVLNLTWVYRNREGGGELH